MIKFEFDGTPLHFQNEEMTCQPGSEALMSWIKSHRSILKDLKGVYIISAFDTEEEGTPRPIYIGKAKNLYKRLYEHCKEMMPELCSEIKKKKDKKWIDAFSEYREEELIVEFVSLDREIDRRWLESRMHGCFDTIFEHKKV